MGGGGYMYSISFNAFFNGCELALKFFVVLIFVVVLWVYFGRGLKVE